ncbi:lysosomal-associated transmembrane protein 4A-like [Lytechinus variegatus]|uniref:lysosomal-associated transmembrane protein 4A-like n=1 Tax=Lytechinus variegatus TaxID=7654 RepID=UPI001BB19507|nr:lysosomal-associated transmembrane protein 4A-like [Lytechinus variegatus]
MRTRWGSPNAPACCLCLDVRTGSILIGLWHLMGQMFAMLLIASMIMRGGDNAVMNMDLDDPPQVPFSANSQHDASDYCVGLVIVFCFLLITTMMMKGIIQYRSGYILPFFCLQLFDFFITFLTCIGVMSYYPDFDYEDSPKFPYNQEFMHWKENLPVSKYDIESPWFTFIALAIFLAIMLFKFYCIACIWACYKHTASVELREIEQCPDTEALLPSYDEAIKIKIDKPPPPPAYQE